MQGFDANRKRTVNELLNMANSADKQMEAAKMKRDYAMNELTARRSDISEQINRLGHILDRIDEAASR